MRERVIWAAELSLIYDLCIRNANGEKTLGSESGSQDTDFNFFFTMCTNLQLRPAAPICQVQQVLSGHVSLFSFNLETCRIDH